MTAATPMIMPSIVSAVRILLRFSALTAIRTIMRNDIDSSLCRPGRRLFRARAVVGPLGAQRVPRHELVLGDPLLAHRTIGHDLTVAELHDSRPVFGDVHFVRDQDHRDAALRSEE